MFLLTLSGDKAFTLCPIEEQDRGIMIAEEGVEIELDDEFSTGGWAEALGALEIDSEGAFLLVGIPPAASLQTRYVEVANWTLASGRTGQEHRAVPASWRLIAKNNEYRPTHILVEFATK